MDAGNYPVVGHQLGWGFESIPRDPIQITNECDPLAYKAALSLRPIKKTRATAAKRDPVKAKAKRKAAKTARKRQRH